MVKDLVCGMKVDENSLETLHLEYQGKTYYFCTNLCLVQFRADPEKYIREQNSEKQHRGKGNP